MSEAPLPCPFCGGEAVKVDGLTVACAHGLCIGWTVRRASPHEWNTRALPAVQPAAHVNETPKSEHEAAVMLTPATKGDWQPIETAPKDGTVYIGCSLDPKRPFGPRRMRWGVAVRADEGYVCNDGKPWFINEDGRHLAPRPTHWTPATKGRDA